MQSVTDCPDEFIPHTTVSVIIPARNEAENIANCLQSILGNDYPMDLVEIIVIDDFSTDKTAEFAAGLLKNQGRVLALKDYLTENEKINAYKKKALEIAIAEAKGDMIVTTDADCICAKSWLRNLVFLHEQKSAQFIAAPVSFFRKNEPAILYYFQSLDFMTMQGITAASIKLKLGNMCNGANLAFEKAAYIKVGGYRGIDHIASGDDMLLMQKIQNEYSDKVFYLNNKNAIVKTEIQDTWQNFLNQRIRWSSKNDQYDDKKLVTVLALVYFFNVSLVAQLILGFFNPHYFQLLLVLLITKTLVELFFLFPVAVFFDKRRELLFFPLLQPLHIAYIVLTGFLGKFGTYKWKGRKVH